MREIKNNEGERDIKSNRERERVTKERELKIERKRDMAICLLYNGSGLGCCLCFSSAGVISGVNSYS